mgnify:CR=1 FL=1
MKIKMLESVINEDKGILRSGVEYKIKKKYGKGLVELGKAIKLN